MLHKTKGIVLHTLKYSETSAIARIYTRNFGLQSYMVNGVHSSRAKQKAAMLLPLTQLELIVYKRENKSLQRISEMKHGYLFQSIPFNMLKGALSMFLVEILNNIIREEEEYPELYDFIEEQIIRLDSSEKVDNNFHLSFLLDLSEYLGFKPTGSYSEKNPYFDLQEGTFVDKTPGSNYLTPSLGQYVHELLHERKVTIPNQQRIELLEKILLFYTLHVDGFKQVKSHQVLHEVFSI